MQVLDYKEHVALHIPEETETSAVNRYYRMIAYIKPERWVHYDTTQILSELVEAKAAILALAGIPSQRSWSEHLQVVQLKREIAGTSRIEGADFTDRELDAALDENVEQLTTRSQRQAAAAAKTYRWIARLPDDKPINAELVCEVHRGIVTDADDDHCPPGILRRKDENVNFGAPRHRGVDGGEECDQAFRDLMKAVGTEFRAHDVLVQALALHYHFAAMHPFLDGNGRTARAVEALMLQRTGLKDTLFIAMSNYYYDEKNEYLKVLAEVRANGHDLTPFLKFGLRGIRQQCQRLLNEIRQQVKKALFRNLMFDLFNRLKTPRKRVVAQRQIELLKLLLEVESMELDVLFRRLGLIYDSLSNSYRAFIRDINGLLSLRAIGYKRIAEDQYQIFVRLEWPTEISETEFFQRVKKMPKSKTHGFLT